MVKPPNRSIRLPAAWMALNIIRARNPRVTPTAAWTRTDPMNPPVSRGITAPWFIACTLGATARASAKARAALTRPGMVRPLNGGEIDSQALALTSASRKAATVSAETPEMFMAWTAAAGSARTSPG
jgi:hypothetical protein